MDTAAKVESRPEGSDRLPVTTLAAYSGIALPLSIVYVPTIIFLPPFYGTEMGVPLATVGLLFLLARIWDGFTDLTIGALSDRTKSRFGKRKIWIACATPFLMLTTYFFFQPPQNVGPLYLLAMILVFYPCWTMIYIPYQSWGAEISGDYKERTRISAFREVATICGTLMVLGMPLFFIDMQVATKREVLEVMAVTFLIIFPLAVYFALKKAPERDVLISRRGHLSWKGTLRVLLVNKPLRRFLAGYMFAQGGIGMYLAMVQLFTISGLGLASKFLMLVFAKHVMAVAVTPLWVKFSEHFSKHLTYCVALFVMLSGLFMLPLIEYGNFWQALALFLYMGIAVAPTHIVPPAVVADTVDYNTLKSGSSEAGTHMALLLIANKFALAIAIGLAYPILDWAGFDGKSSDNSAFAMQALFSLSTYVPALLLICGIAVLWRFPLDGRRHAIIQRRVERISK